MALFDKLTKRVETRAKAALDRGLGAVETAAAEFPDIMLHREGDQLVISGRGLLRRWLTDVRLRFAIWKQR
jgi:hypothetical protein